MISRHIFVATRVSWSSPLISQLLASPVVVLVDENSGNSSKSPSDARDDNKSIFFDDNFPADRRTYGRRRRLRLKTDIWTTSRWLSTVVITSCRHYGHHLPTTARSRPLGALATATMTAVPQLLAPPPTSCSRALSRMLSCRILALLWPWPTSQYTSCSRWIQNFRSIELKM